MGRVCKLEVTSVNNSVSRGHLLSVRVVGCNIFKLYVHGHHAYTYFTLTIFKKQLVKID